MISYVYGPFLTRILDLSDNTRSTFPLNSNIRPSPSSPTLSTRPTKRARIEPPSPLPSESHLESQADRLTKPRADALQPAPQTPPTSHAPSTPPGGSHSRTNARRLSAPSPNTPKRKSFAQLSSPDTSPSISGSPPLTPSFDSQIARAIRGLGAVPRIGGVKERVISRIGDRFDSDSNAESSSGTSGVSAFSRVVVCIRLTNLQPTGITAERRTGTHAKHPLRLGLGLELGLRLGRYGCGT